MDDREWLALLEKSPRDARYELISRYGGLVYTVIQGRLRGIADREDIKDCVSDAFVEIFKSMDRFDADKGTLKSFITAIARNTALHAFERMSLSRKRSVPLDDDIQLPPSPDDTELTVDERMSRARLWELVDELGEPDSAILVYQYIYDMKVQDIADRLSMTAAAVQKRSIRARAKLKSIIEKERGVFYGE